jgi:hypothetical protein
MSQGSQRKKKILAYVMYAVLAVVIVVQAYRAGSGTAGVLRSAGIVVAIGVFLVFSMSDKRQENMIVKRSGVDKAEKNGQLPHITLSAEDTGLFVTALGSDDKPEKRQAIGYPDILGVEETDRLILLQMKREYELVPKAAFADDAARDDFLSYVKEKVAAAKENPDAYKNSEVLNRELKAAGQADDAPAEGDESGLEAPESQTGDDGEVKASDIDRVDTSGMGKLGKIAHMVAAEPDEADGAAKKTEKAADADDEAAKTETAEDDVVPPTENFDKAMTEVTTEINAEEAQEAAEEKDAEEAEKAEEAGKTE